MFCVKCGKELPDGAKFCSGCGAPVTASAQPEIPPIDLEAPMTGFMAPEEAPAVEEPIAVEEPPAEELPEAEAPPAEEEFPAVAEAPAMEAPPAEEEPPAAQDAPAVGEPPRFDAPPAGQGPEQPAAKRRGKGFFAALGVGAVAAVAALALLVKLALGMAGGGGKTSVVYLNDDYELMYLADLKEKTTALEVTEQGSGWLVKFSPDGKILYFADASKTLYKITVAELKKGGRPERVARNVEFCTVLKDGRLLYWEYSENGRKLSLYDGTESFRLLRDYWNYELSEDQKTLYYTEMDTTDYTMTLYQMAMTKDAKGERLLEGASTIYTSYDSGVLVYGVYDNDAPDDNNLTVYSCKPGEKAEKLVSGISRVEGVTADGGKVSFYYRVEDVEEHVLYDFVTDDKAEEDAQILQESGPAYPNWREYEVWDIAILDEQLYYVDSYNSYHLVDLRDDYFADYVTVIRLDTGMTVEEIIAQYGWDDVLMYLDAYTGQGAYYLIYDYAQERYEADLRDYDSWHEAYNEAEHREYLREYLKETTYGQSSYSLYRYDGGPAKDPIVTRVADLRSAPDSGIFLYTKADAVDVGKVADVTDLDDYGDVRDQVRDLLDAGGGSGEREWFQNVGGRESALAFDEDDTRIDFIYCLNGKEIVLDVYDGYESSLRAYSIGKDALTFQSTIAEGDDFSCDAGKDAAGKDVLYVFTNVDYDGYDAVGDFYVYRDGKLEPLVKEVYGAIILDESGATYVITDMDSREDSAELSLLKDNKLTAIGDLYGDFVFLDGKQVLYISDGDLMLWDGKENRRIARDVEYVWAGAEEDYSIYEPY